MCLSDLIPLKDLSEGKRDILAALRDRGDLLLPELMKEKTESERSRLSYHLKDLKKDGLVETVKEGRNLKVSLTFAGRLYSAGLGRR